MVEIVKCIIMSADQEETFIQTPPDTYKPDKIEGSLTIDQLQQQEKW